MHGVYTPATVPVTCKRGWRCVCMYVHVQVLLYNMHQCRTLQYHCKCYVLAYSQQTEEEQVCGWSHGIENGCVPQLSGGDPWNSRSSSARSQGNRWSVYVHTVFLGGHLKCMGQLIFSSYDNPITFNKAYILYFLLTLLALFQVWELKWICSRIELMWMEGIVCTLCSMYIRTCG